MTSCPSCARAIMREGDPRTDCPPREPPEAVVIGDHDGTRAALRRVSVALYRPASSPVRRDGSEHPEEVRDPAPVTSSGVKEAR